MCLGCSLSSKKLPILLINENDYFISILDIDPINDGHILILPKNHYQKLTELTDNEVLSLRNLIKTNQELLYDKLHYANFSIHINEGIINDLDGHLHIHIIPRSINDNITLSNTELEISKLDQIFQLLKN